MSQNTPETKRLFIGGLFNGATPEDLKGRFEKYGIVKSVDMKIKKNDIGEIVNTFAFINFDSTPAKIRQFIDVFNKTKWKGKELKVQLAEESFIDRLERERKSVVKVWSPEKNNKEDVNPHHAIRELKVKGPPGTPVQGKEGWVVGKYSQIVPILKVKKNGSKKPVVFDPSKNCHALKRFVDDDIAPKINVDQLTWKLDEKVTSSQVKNQKTSKQKLKQKKKKSVTDDSSDDVESDDDSDTSCDKKQSSKSTVTRQSYDSVDNLEFSSDSEEISRNTSGKKYTSHSELNNSSLVLSKHKCEQRLNASGVKSKINFEDNSIIDDSDNESSDSRDSCDTDEIVKRSRNCVNTKGQNDVQGLQPMVPLKHLEKSKHDFSTTSGDDITKRLVLSEFDDGLSSSENEEEDEEKESADAGDTPEDVFDLISSGRMDGLLQDLFKKNSKHKEASSVNTSSISDDVGKDFDDAKSLDTRKRKRAEPEISKKKKPRIESTKDKQTSSTANTDKIESSTIIDKIESKVSKVSKKRKRNQIEEEDDQMNKPDFTESQSNTVSTSVKGSLDVEIPKKRKKILSRGETGKQSNQTLENHEVENDHLKSSFVKENSNEQSKSLKKQEISPKKTPGVESKKSLMQSSGSVESPKKNQSQVNILGFKDFQSFRYDPSAIDHEKFELKDSKEQKKPAKFSPKKEGITLKQPEAEVQNDKANKVPDATTKDIAKKKKKKKTTEVDEEISVKNINEKPEKQESEALDLKKFCEVDVSVVDAFKEPSDAPFSLDVIFGGANEEFSEKEIDSKTAQGNWKKKKVKVVVEENSDDDDDDGDFKTESKSKPSQKKIEGGFFYRSNDSRLKDPKFICEKEIEEIRQEWLEKRPQLVEAYRMKKKKPFRPYGKAPRPQGKKPQGNGLSRNRSFSR